MCIAGYCIHLGQKSSISRFTERDLHFVDLGLPMRKLEYSIDNLRMGHAGSVWSWIAIFETSFRNIGCLSAAF